MGLFRGLRASMKVDEGLVWDEWQEVATEIYHEDRGLKFFRASVLSSS